MKTSGLGRYSLSIGAAAALLAACGVLRPAQDDMQPPIGAPADAIAHRMQPAKFPTGSCIASTTAGSEHVTEPTTEQTRTEL